MVRARGERRGAYPKNCGLWLPLPFLAALFLMTALCFDLYYDLNDDSQIKDILAGAYSGSPDGHTNQLLYPLGLCLAFLYRLFPDLPVYGLFLSACLYLSLYLIMARSLRYCRGLRGRLLLLTAEAVIAAAFLMWELLYLQYTAVCGLLAAAALFWFLTTDFGLSPKRFFQANLPALLLAWLAFLLRSEMLLLTAPLLAAAGLWHWGGEIRRSAQKQAWAARAFGEGRALKYPGFAGLAAAGCLLLLWGDYRAYWGEGWQSYRGFFDARTTLYDYTWYPDIEEHPQVYEELGLSPEQAKLIDSYNFGLDTSIDEEALLGLAAFDEKGGLLGTTAERVKNAFWEMGRRLLGSQDAPYSYFALALYALVSLGAVLQKRSGIFRQLLLLGIMRSIPWLYLLLAQRAVNRITHPLYFLESIFLAGIFFQEFPPRLPGKGKGRCRLAAAGLLAVLALAVAPAQYRKAREEQSRRESVNGAYEAFRAYAAKEPDNYYYLDVYSTVDYTEKVFDGNTNRRKNYDLLGGWVCHSPLQEEAILPYTGGESLAMAEALLRENFYLVLREGRDPASVTGYYASAGTPVELTLMDRVGGPGEALLIYSIDFADEIK